MMKINDRIKRRVSFYFSATLFFLLLPIILSYSLGYHIDFRALKIYKTGIIYIKSQPQGASIYINNRRIADATPARIEELKPGTYRVDVRRDGFYPWQKDLVVRPNMVTRADEIVLFPLTRGMNRVCDYEVWDFIASGKNYIYYMAKTGLLRSNMDGSSMKRLSPYSSWPRDIIDKRFSPDNDKILYFNKSHIWVIYLNLDKMLTEDGEAAKVEKVLESPNPIIDAYWYSESNHIVYITDSDINVAELDNAGKSNAVMLYKFNTKPQGLYYDYTSDSLYFTDFKIGPDAKEANYLYRLDLRQKFFGQFMQRLKKEFDIRYEKR